MSGDEGRDPVVTAALRAIPVPDHRPGFWDDLEQAAAVTTVAPNGRGERPGAHSSPTPAAPPPSGRRRGGRAVLAAAAAVLVVAAATGAVLLTGDDDDDGSELADASGRATTTALLDGDPPTTQADLVTTTTAQAGTDPAPATAARTWLTAIADGEFTAAAELLGHRSLAHLASRAPAVDPAGLMAESQEGYGAWAAVDDLTVTAVEIGPVPQLGDGARLAIVILAGTYTGEGTTGFRVETLPLVDDGEGWRVEHLAFGERSPDGTGSALVFTLPEQSEDGSLGAMGPADDINVFVPAAGTVYFLIDDLAPIVDATSMVGRVPEPFALCNPAEDLGSGTHRLSVVAVGDDGTISHYGGTFVIEG